MYVVVDAQRRRVDVPRSRRRLRDQPARRRLRAQGVLRRQAGRASRSTACTSSDKRRRAEGAARRVGGDRNDDPVAHLVRAPRPRRRRGAVHRVRGGRAVRPAGNALAQGGPRVATARRWSGRSRSTRAAASTRSWSAASTPTLSRRWSPRTAQAPDRITCAPPRSGASAQRRKALGRQRSSRPTGATTRSSRSTATARWSRRSATTRSSGNDEFELGGYPAVFDALHGYLRDDMWLLGGKMYVVVARPVEYDATQRPAGAIVGLKEVDAALRERPRQAHAHQRRLLRGGREGRGGGVGVEGFDAEKLDAVARRPAEDRRQDVRRRRALRRADAHRRPRRDVRAPPRRRVGARRRASRWRAARTALGGPMGF